jgi:hypothetical protein
MRLVTNYKGTWRDEDMNAAVFRKYCEHVGLACIGQELINWSGRFLIDAFSAFTPKDSIWTRPNRVLKNRSFWNEATIAQSISSLYGPPSNTLTHKGVPQHPKC